MICLFQNFEAEFLWKVCLIILISGIILKTERRQMVLATCKVWLNVLATSTWVKVQKYRNPELTKFKTFNLQYAFKTVKIPNLNGQISLNKLKINQRSYYNQPNSVF